MMKLLLLMSTHSPLAAPSQREEQEPADARTNKTGESIRERAIRYVDRNAWMFVPLWVGVYLATVIPGLTRPLWYDELVTYYVASSTSLSRLFQAINHVDLNPPLYYLTVRSSMALWGDSPAVVRLASLFTFLAAALLIFECVRRRIGGAFGLLALGVLFQCGYLYYAIEARPYAMMLFFYALGVLSWSVVVNKSSWSWAHAGIMASIAGLILTHCFGPLYAASIGCGELVRSLVTRRFDRKTWLAILLPLPLMLTYLFIARASDMVFPPAFQATGDTALQLYESLFQSLRNAIIVLLLLTAWPRMRVVSLWSVMKPYELAVAISGLLAPLVIIGFAMRTHIAFWPRYAIVFIIPITFLLVSLFASLSGRRTGVALMAATSLLGVFVFQHFPQHKPAPVSTDYRNVCPNLPFVAASGLTFFEMDHREPPEMVNRLYYLTDREAALKFAHATIFEGFATIKNWFPVRANVEPYSQFVAKHPYFMVLATPDYPEDWLMRKLAFDGAQFRYFGNEPTGYKDGMLFEVRMPSAGTQSPRSSTASTKASNETCGIVQDGAIADSK